MFLPREKKHRYYIDHREGAFYIRTNQDGINFAIMTAPENDVARKNWKVFVAHREDVRIDNIDLFKDFAVSVEKSQALAHLRVHNFKTGTWTAIAFPGPVYSVFPGGTPEYASTTYRYNYQSLITPSSIFDYDTRSGKSTLLKQQEVLGGYDPKQYASERLWATARDGVKVPHLHRLQEGHRARRQGAALPLRLRLLRIRHAGLVFQPAPESARSRHGRTSSPTSAAATKWAKPGATTACS